MAGSKIITYECEQCGSEIVVTALGKGRLSPIYCCGLEVNAVSPVAKKTAAKRKPPQKVAKKKSAVNKKPAGKRKATK